MLEQVCFGLYRKKQELILVDDLKVYVIHEEKKDFASLEFSYP